MKSEQNVRIFPIIQYRNSRITQKYRNRPNFGHGPNFGHFWVVLRYFELRHYFNDVKVPKNSQDQCEFEYLFIF
jgi:hypothetical protein